ncbi:MAG: hypothetical protein HKO79_04275, partial [Desulfobacterales bacterium]|nr:hypothetical protein [Desulfobacterales bacterium]
PIVTSVPLAGQTIPGIVDTTIRFNFSTNMTQAGITEANFVLASIDPLWIVVGGSLNWPNLPSTNAVEIDVTNANSIPVDPFTITLSGFTDTGGTPLGGQTIFSFN